MKKNIKFGITMVAIFIWCGMMYPELVFTENVLCVSEQDVVMQEDIRPGSCVRPAKGRLAEGRDRGVYYTAELYCDFLQSEPEQIEVKSRVFEWLEEKVLKQ